MNFSGIRGVIGAVAAAGRDRGRRPQRLRALRGHDRSAEERARLLQAWGRVLDAMGSRAPPAGVRGPSRLENGGLRRCLGRRPAADESRAVGCPANATDQNLAWLYQHCLFAGFPSLAERLGGCPVGEAAWFGRDGIASSRTSIPEAGGSGRDYVDPREWRSVAAAMLRADSGSWLSWGSRTRTWRRCTCGHGQTWPATSRVRWPDRPLPRTRSHPAGRPQHLGGDRGEQPLQP